MGLRVVERPVVWHANTKKPITIGTLKSSLNWQTKCIFALPYISCPNNTQVYITMRNTFGCTLIYLRGSITVRLTCFLDSPALLMLNEQQYNLFSQIQPSHTGGQPYRHKKWCHEDAQNFSPKELHFWVPSWRHLMGKTSFPWSTCICQNPGIANLLFQ